MRLRRLAACAAILASLGASGAQAGGLYEMAPASPTRIVPMLSCAVVPQAIFGTYRIRASVAYTLPAGTRIHWDTSDGYSGDHTLSQSLAAGSWATLEIVHTYAEPPWGCSARVA